METILKNHLLHLDGLSKAYGELVIYRDFSITFPKGEITSILGPSGCGKTTLLNILSGSVKPGNIGLNEFLGRKISVIFQDSRLLPWKTCLENIEFVMPSDFNPSKCRNLALEYLGMMGLYEFKDYFPAQLSGGMKQRVSMARAFAFPSEIILMDEPFRALDVKLKENLMLEFLKLWEKDRRTVIFVTHDVTEALKLGSLIYVFSRPEVRLAGTFINDGKADKAELNRNIVELF